MTSSAILKNISLTLAVCALAMRLVLPSGFMLMPTPDTALPTLVICSGQGSAVLSARDMAGLDQSALRAIAKAQNDQADDGVHDGGDGRHDDGEKHPCAFAVASAAVDLTTTAHPVALVATPVVATLSLSGFARPGRGLAAPPPPKTGPPTLS